MKLTKKEKINILLTVAFLVLVAGLGSLFVNLGIEWYSKLNTPSQWIPSFVIPIVWTVVYISFAIIFAFLYIDNLINKKIEILGIINGILNILWCLVFFTLNQLLLGNIIIIVNAFFATYLLIELLKINKWYINFLLLYPIWIYVATTLNLALWILN